MKRLSVMIFVLFCCTTYPSVGFTQGGAANLADAEVRYVASEQLTVFEQPSKESRVVGVLKHLDKIMVLSEEVDLTEAGVDRITDERGIWLRIVSPYEGFIFQRRIIKPFQKRAPVGNRGNGASEDQRNIKGDANEPSMMDFGMERAQVNTERSDLTVGGSLGIYNVPEESGYTSDFGETLSFHCDYTFGKAWWSRARVGLNITTSKGTYYNSKTTTLYGAIRKPLKNRGLFDLPDGFSPAQITLLGGGAYLMGTMTSDGAGSASTFGYILGGTLSTWMEDWLQLGIEVLYISGQGNFSGTNKYLGSQQINFQVGYSL